MESPVKGTSFVAATGFVAAASLVGHLAGSQFDSTASGWYCSLNHTD